MAEERQLSVAEVRKTMATSLAAAFGFVIALLWNQVVMGGLKLAGVDTQAPADALAYVVFIVTAVIMTVVMIILIILFSRRGSKGKKKE